MSRFFDRATIDYYVNEADPTFESVAVTLGEIVQQLLGEIEATKPRPIADAPLEGRFWGLVDDDAIAMSWHPGFGEFVSSFRRHQLEPGYTFDDGSTFQDHHPVIHKPTHWLPIVEPEDDDE